MKKILTIFISIIIVVSLTACNSGTTDNDSGVSGQNDQAVSANQNDSNDNQGEEEENTDTESSGPDYEKQGLPIPNGYPEDLVPLMEGYKIVAGASGEKEIWVKYMVDVEIDEAAAFYKDILSKGNLKNAQKMGDKLYMLDGEFGDKTVSISVTTEIMYDNYQSNVLISIKGDMGAEEYSSEAANVDLSTANKNITDMDQVPGDYPTDLVPLYGSSMVKHGEKSEYNGKDIFLLQIYSKDNKDMVNAFYKEVLKNAKDKEEGTMSTGSYIIGGVVGKYKVSLLIGDLDLEGYEYKTLTNIQLDVLE